MKGPPSNCGTIRKPRTSQPPSESVADSSTASVARRIFIFDEECVFGQLLELAWRSAPRNDVLGHAAFSPAALATCVDLRPTLIILNPGWDATTAAAMLTELRATFPSARILVTLHRPRHLDPLAAQAIDAQADGIVFRSEPLEEWELALSVLEKGGRYVSPGWRCQTEPSSREPLSGLSKRQQQVLRMIAEGFSTKEIGAALGLSCKTAGHHRLRLMKKLKLHDPVSVTRFALSTGFVPLP